MMMPAHETLNLHVVGSISINLQTLYVRHFIAFSNSGSSHLHMHAHFDEWYTEDPQADDEDGLQIMFNWYHNNMCHEDFSEWNEMFSEIYQLLCQASFQRAIFTRFIPLGALVVRAFGFLLLFERAPVGIRNASSLLIDCCMNHWLACPQQEYSGKKRYEWIGDTHFCFYLLFVFLDNIVRVGQRRHVH